MFEDSIELNKLKSNDFLKLFGSCFLIELNSTILGLIYLGSSE